MSSRYLFIDNNDITSTELLSLWNNPRYADMTVTVADEKYSLHKMILGMRSLYFDRLFIFHKDISEVTFDKNAKIMKNILRWIYGDEIIIPHNKYAEYLEITDYLDIKILYRYLINCFPLNISTEDFLKILTHGGNAVVELLKECNLHAMSFNRIIDTLPTVIEYITEDIMQTLIDICAAIHVYQNFIHVMNRWYQFHGKKLSYKGIPSTLRCEFDIDSYQMVDIMEYPQDVPLSTYNIHIEYPYIDSTTVTASLFDYCSIFPGQESKHILLTASEYTNLLPPNNNIIT